MSDGAEDSSQHIPFASSHAPLQDALTSVFAWPNNTITYAFAPAGTQTERGPYRGGSDFTSPWSADQTPWVEEIFAQVTAITGLEFREVASLDSADIRFQQVQDVAGGFVGYARYPSPATGSTIVVDADRVDPANGNLLVHEVGHALGLEHSHDGSGVFPGLTDPFDLGLHSLNNELFTTMSYNGPVDPLRPNLRFDVQSSGFMAIDIAALQAIYGANQSTAKGNTDYRQTNILHSIWDTGGIDTIHFGAATRDAVIDLRAATQDAAPGGGGYLSFVYDAPFLTYGGYTIATGVLIENGFGGGGDDDILGNASANLLRGNDGADTVKGSGGNDQLFGGRGLDQLNGGGHHDTLDGGKGSDILNGDAGHDQLHGGGQADTLRGGEDNDTVNGGDGEDRLLGGLGQDLLRGSDGRDWLDGGQGNDTLHGGAGSDTITGGGGRDTLNGNKGADRFEIYSGDGQDSIDGFDADQDVLALDQTLWVNRLDRDQIIKRFADIDQNDAVLRFESDTVRLTGFADDYASDSDALAALAAIIELI